MPAFWNTLMGISTLASRHNPSDFRTESKELIQVWRFNDMSNDNFKARLSNPTPK